MSQFDPVIHDLFDHLDQEDRLDASNEEFNEKVRERVQELMTNSEDIDLAAADYGTNEYFKVVAKAVQQLVTAGHVDAITLSDLRDQVDELLTNEAEYRVRKENE